MTARTVTDNELSQLGDKNLNLFRLVRDGKLPSGPVLMAMQRIIEGNFGDVVDLDAAPLIPDGFTVECHRKGGAVDFSTAKFDLYLAEAQRKGCVGGYDLRGDVADKRTLNAVALDFLLANPHRIPEDWKARRTFFWGTVYRNGDGMLCVRCLCWRGDGWNWGYEWLDDVWDSVDPAAVLASST